MLTILWFVLITVLWTGFFVLEGFDLGVGMLHGVVGQDEAGRRAAINTIGPLWDGNEVWLVVAAAAMFAAFPGWYATMFSAFYLALILILVGLIVRGVSFEFRGKFDDPRWRRAWDRLMAGGSLLVPLLIGVALGDLLHGVPIGADQEYAGSLLDLFTPYGVFVGLTFVALCLVHGATFLTLKTAGEPRRRARRLAHPLGVVTAVMVLGYAIWTHVTAGNGFLPNLLEIAAVLAAFTVPWLLREGSDGWAFTATAVTIATSVSALFVELYPRVMVSTISPAFDLTVHNTASGSYALAVMTVVALVLLPFVLLYQGWTYYVFRRRISPEAFRDSSSTTTAPH